MYGEAFSIMGGKITPLLRHDPSLAKRMLSISGLEWNEISKNKPRDWVKAACAVAVESALVGKYRPQLLEACGLACNLREILQGIFVKRLGHNMELLQDGKMTLSTPTMWDFPDGIHLEGVQPSTQVINTNTLQEAWKVSLGSRKGVASEKRDTIATLLQQLQKNKFLQCSEPGIASGTVETIASFAFSLIGTVCNDITCYSVILIFFLCQGCISEQSATRA